MTEEETLQLRKENQELREALKQMQELLRVALARIEELEKQKTPPPAFVKANKKKQPEDGKKVRKKREAKHNRARPRSAPTQIIEHHVVNCPDCDLRLGGISLARVREIIDIPPPAPVEVTHHYLYKGWCATCQKWREAPVDVQEQAIGHGRIGVRLTSLIATLRLVLRLPIRQIQWYLQTLHAVTISIGELVELQYRLKDQMQPHLDALKAEIRASPAIQMDETGWREDGENGYIWAASTPHIRYYEYHHTRSGTVVKELVGEDFAGVLGSDFYAGYNTHQGLHQRCWVHFLRDVHDLKEKYPYDEPLLSWAKGIKAMYDEAVAWVEQEPRLSLTLREQKAVRVAHQHAFEAQLWQLCQPYVRTEALQHTLCERVERFLPELFVFVAIPGVPAHNNLAERSVRPLVVARKISGGTRSPKGSQTRMGLVSLFGTWMAQSLNPFHHCLALLSTESSLGQV